MLKIPFNAITTVTMKAITVECVVHKCSMNHVNIVQISDKSCVYWPISKNKHIYFWLCIDVYISPRLPL